MAKRLLIHLEKCYQCRRCTAQCSYPGRGAKNTGYVRCIALAAQEHVCRRCDEPPCVAACPQQALEKRADGMLDRHSMRCTSCQTCTIACPFGVIQTQLVEYKTGRCDLCAGRADDEHPPACVLTCPEKALEWIDVAESPEKDVYAVRNGRFFVHVRKWMK